MFLINVENIQLVRIYYKMQGKLGARMGNRKSSWTHLRLNFEGSLRPKLVP